MPVRCTLTPLAMLTPEAHAQWRDLASAATEPNPFMEVEFTLASARTLPDGQKILLLTVKDVSEVILVLPVMRVPGFRRLRVPAISAWVHDYCFLGTPLVRVGAEERAWAAVLGFLIQGRYAPWLVLPLMSADGPVCFGLRAALQARGLTATQVQSYERAAAVRGADGSVASSPLKGVHLKGLRRQRRRLAAESGGQEVIFVVATGDASSVEAFLALEATGWKGRSGTAMAVRERDAGLLRDLVTAWPNRVHVLSLRSGDKLLAAQVNLQAPGTSWCFKTAYDETLRRWSPGVLLELDVVNWFATALELHLLDSCAVSGHEMAERVFPDRRSVTTMLVPLTVLGRWAVISVPTLLRLSSAVKVFVRREK